jgi:hypothetical protein
MRSRGWDSEEMVQTPLGNCSINTQGRARIVECPPTRKWARIASFTDGSGTGQIPVHHRISPPPETLLQLAV